MRFDKDTLHLSSIFDWYQKDFVSDEIPLLEALAQYAKPELKAQLLNFKGKKRYDYDWSLNADQ